MASEEIVQSLSDLWHQIADHDPVISESDIDAAIEYYRAIPSTSIILVHELNSLRDQLETYTVDNIE